MKFSFFSGQVLCASLLLAFFVGFASCVIVDDPPVPINPPVAISTYQSSVGEKELIILDASASRVADNAADSVTIVSYHWRQIGGPYAATSGDPTTVQTNFTAPFVSEVRTLRFALVIIDSNGLSASDTLSVTVFPSPDVDADRDGLIEIDTLEMLHNMRYNLAGTSYDTDENDSSGNAGNAPGDTGLSGGCPNAVCSGYELIRDLNFDANGSGHTWIVDGESEITLDIGDNHDIYFNIDTGGWVPIGTYGEGRTFTATFDGNGNIIDNLAIRSDLYGVGLFGYIANNAIIRNIGLTNTLSDHSGNINGLVSVGGLVGSQTGGDIIASYMTGRSYGGHGAFDRVGGLVGSQTGGRIVASFTEAFVDGYGGVADSVGGLVGSLDGGSISASYAIGTVRNRGRGNVGGLVGDYPSGTIVASYADGTVETEEGRIGALIGGIGRNHYTVSYGFGVIITEYLLPWDDPPVVNSEGTPPRGISSASDLTPANIDGQWHDGPSNTFNAWDMGNRYQRPVLKYADYDGSGNRYSCDMFPAVLCGTIIGGQHRF